VSRAQAPALDPAARAGDPEFDASQPERRTDSDPDLEKLGVFTFSRLEKETKNEEEHMIDGFMKKQSLNVVVGDSGLGKTALAVQLGSCVASGAPFLGRRVVKRGKVLYCDAESGMGDFKNIEHAISTFLGFTEPPKDFLVWNPYWTPIPAGSRVRDALLDRVYAVRPELVVVDPLRLFWPEALEKGSETSEMIGQLRTASQKTGCSWLLLHHIRKADRGKTRVTLEDGLEFFQEAAGAHAIINSTDTRLGLERSSAPRVDLNLAGFTRIKGWVGPFRISREHDDDGRPAGYKVMTGVEFLNDRYRGIYEDLDSEFRFKDVKRADGMSSSSASSFLEQCKANQLIQKDGQLYKKTA